MQENIERKLLTFCIQMRNLGYAMHEKLRKDGHFMENRNGKSSANDKTTNNAFDSFLDPMDTDDVTSCMDNTKNDAKNSEKNTTKQCSDKATDKTTNSTKDCRS